MSERTDKPTIVVHAYPVYVDDWRGSETRMEPTLEQRMLLWELIFYCFKEGSLPTDLAKLRKIADCSEKEWARAWPAIQHKFEERAGRLHHCRVDAEMARITETKEKAARSGAAGARKRWGAYSHPIATPSNRISAPLPPPQCDSIASNPTPIPNPNPKPLPMPLPLQAATPETPDLDQLIHDQARRMIQIHPEPAGSIPYLQSALERRLLGAANPAGVLASIETVHRAACDRQKRKPARFWPTASRWVADQDDMKGVPTDESDDGLF